MQFTLLFVAFLSGLAMFVLLILALVVPMAPEKRRWLIILCLALFVAGLMAYSLAPLNVDHPLEPTATPTIDLHYQQG